MNEVPLFLCLYVLLRLKEIPGAMSRLDPLTPWDVQLDQLSNSCVMYTSGSLKGDVSYCSHAIWKAVECFVPLHKFPNPAAWSHCNVCTILSMTVTIKKQNVLTHRNKRNSFLVNNKNRSSLRHH